MVNKYTLGGAIAAIVLLALMGMRSASNWLAQSDSRTTTQDNLVADNATSTADNRTGSQPNGQSGIPDDQIISQTGDGTTGSSPTSSTLDQAGNNIQRQKSAEQDPVVADTSVDVIPAADSSNVSAQGNTVPTPPASTPSTSTPAPSSPVPALW